VTIPQQLAGQLAIPAIVAPMFLISGPDLVVECCKAGLLGTFPALNQRTTDDFVAWLDEIERRLDGHAAPYGVNLIVHRTNSRLQADLDVIVKRRVPLVITSLGTVREVIDAVHGYGGLVFHDVISARHAEKASKAGADGLIAVSAGAGECAPACPGATASAERGGHQREAAALVPIRRPRQSHSRRTATAETRDDVRLPARAHEGRSPNVRRLPRRRSPSRTQRAHATVPSALQAAPLDSRAGKPYIAVRSARHHTSRVPPGAMSPVHSSRSACDT